jgi:hypothetical protein
METKDKGQVVYYYDRASRMEKAGPGARFINERYGAKRPGILRSLTATRSLRYLFFSLIFMLVAVMVVGYVQGTRNSGSVAGNSLSVAALWFEGHVYVTVKRTAPWFGPRPKAHDRAAVEIRTGDGAGYALGVLQSGDEEQRLRFPAETKPARIVVVASAGDDAVELVAKVE